MPGSSPSPPDQARSARLRASTHLNRFIVLATQASKSEKIMAFTNPFGPPTDPKYDRFKEGIDNWVLGKPAVLELRWSPWEANGTWRRYLRSRFAHIDFGQPPGPPSPSSASGKLVMAITRMRPV